PGSPPRGPRWHPVTAAPPQGRRRRRWMCCPGWATPCSAGGPWTCSAGPSPPRIPGARSRSSRPRPRRSRRAVRCGGGAAERRGVGKLGPAAGTRVAALSGPSSLTRREREVARLAVAGSTARQIGERLFIGERTVEGHLARVYAKLGDGSKLQLVARAADFGL